jgi:hypothetical protein
MTGIKQVDNNTAADLGSTDINDAAESFLDTLDAGSENGEQGEDEGNQQGVTDLGQEEFEEEHEDPEQLNQDAEAADEGQFEEAEEVEEQGEEFEDVYTVMVNGQEQNVTFDELQKGYARQSDYTRKTTELANERNEFASEQQAVNNERQQYSQLLGALQHQLEQVQGPEPDWVQLAQNDPGGYQVKRAEWDARQGQIQAAQQERERVNGTMQQEQQRLMQQYARDQFNSLVAAKPELADTAKARAFRGQILEYANAQYGLTGPELASIMDHRGLLILEKAMRFDALQKRGTKVQQKIKRRKSPNAKPGAAQPRVHVTKRPLAKAKRKLARTGDVKDAAAAMEALL